MANQIAVVEALHFALSKDGQALSSKDNFQFETAWKLFMLVCLDLEYYQPISPKRIIRIMSSFNDIGKLIRCQDHLLRIIRSLEPINSLVVEEACLGFILPTLRAWEKKHRVKYFRTINTVAQFLKNVQLKDLDDKDLDAFASFQKTVKQHDRFVARAISKTLPKFSIHENMEAWKFGPGASYEVNRHQGKGPKVHFISTQPCNYHVYRLLSSMGFRHWTRPTWNDQYSKAISVPKSAKTKRIITVEPTFNTMATQALRSQLLEYAEQTGCHYFPDDQTFNRVLALAGSANGSFATIDLSAASDSVTTALLDDLFSGTGLLPYLHDARVSSCLVKGKRVSLSTYAGMGNAVTFVTETIVFDRIVEFVYRVHFPNKRRRYVVYGDDIVVEREVYKWVIHYLTLLGFKVNEEKSYNSAHPFRESCGIEALGGHVVTPVRISRGLYFAKTNSAVPHLIALSNRLYAHGYGKAASAVRQWFRLKDRLIPYTDDESEYGMLIWSKPDNRHLKCRYNADLQRTEYQVRVFNRRMTLGQDDDRYQAWLMSHSQREDKISVQPKSNGLPDIALREKVGSPIDLPRLCWISA